MLFMQSLAEKRRRRFAVGCLLFLVLLIFSFVFGLFNQTQKKPFYGSILTVPKPLPSFSFQGMDNRAFLKDNLEGQWTLLFFGFTHCSSVCPLTLTELASFYRLLEKKQIKPPQVIMLSLDPEEDSLKRLKDYMQAFHPSFYGASGTEAEVKALTQKLGIVYERKKPSEGGQGKGDSIQHAATLFLVNPQAELKAVFTPPHHAQALAEDYAQIVVS